MSVNNLVIDLTLMQIRMLAEVFLCSVLSKDNFADYSQFVSRQREKGRHTLQKIVAGNCSRAPQSIQVLFRHHLFCYYHIFFYARIATAAIQYEVALTEIGKNFQIYQNIKNLFPSTLTCPWKLGWMCIFCVTDHIVYLYVGQLNHIFFNSPYTEKT